jgi:hypothetical protein
MSLFEGRIVELKTVNYLFCALNVNNVKLKYKQIYYFVWIAKPKLDFFDNLLTGFWSTGYLSLVRIGIQRLYRAPSPRDKNT